MSGYLILAGIFALMIIACFGFAISELWHPRDPGPLPIDVSRDINHRYFASLIRREVRYIKDIIPLHNGSAEPMRSLRLGPNTSLQDGSTVTHIIGDGSVARNARVESFACDGVALVLENATVAAHAEGLKELWVSAGAVVGGRATSLERIVLAPASRVFNAAAPMIRTSGLEIPTAPDEIAPWDEILDADFEWLLSMGTPVDLALRDIELTAGSMLDSKEALLRYERETLRPIALIDLRKQMTPAWIGSMKGWYIGAATVRIRGDVEIPEDAFVPYSLIVEGALLAQPGARFGGGIHASGDIVLGDECRVAGSVAANRHVVLGDDVVIDECVSAGSDAFIGSKVWIGGARNGGLAAAGSIELGFGTVVRHRLYAEHGAFVRALASESESENLQTFCSIEQDALPVKATMI
ncbi:MAG: hypothetical protein ACYDCC_03830 [Actinomycetota bacterium]